MNATLIKDDNFNYYFFENSLIKIQIRPYYFVDNNKIEGGFVGCLTNLKTKKSFNSFINYGALPLNDVIKLTAKISGSIDFFNKPIFLKILKSK